MIMGFGRMTLTKKAEGFGEKTFPAPLRPPEIPRGLPRGTNPDLRGEVPTSSHPYYA